MNSDFILLNRTYQTVEFVLKMLENFPKKEVSIKLYLERVLYEMVECLFTFNVNDSKKIKSKYIKDYLVKLSMVNFLLHEAFHKKCITYKQSTKVAAFLLELKKIGVTILKGLDNAEI